MLAVPTELALLAVLLAVGALALAWAGRAAWRCGPGAGILNALYAVFGQFLFLMMLAACALQVGIRYLLPGDLVLPWTEEVARLCMVWAALWGAAALHRADDHIRLTALYDLLPRRGRLAVAVLGDVLTIALLAMVAWYGWQTARALDIMSTIAIGLPLSVFAYSVPAACLLMVAHSLGHLAQRLRGREPAPMAPDREQRA